MSTYDKGVATKLTTHFKSTEFDCKGRGCCKQTTVDDALVAYLQRMRSHFGQPITVNSGYRCATHNKAVGGANRSQHKSGCAADIAVRGVEPLAVAQYAESIGVRGIGLYDTFVHVDTRDTPQFWRGQDEVPCGTFHAVTVEAFRRAARADGIDIPATGGWDDACIAVASTRGVCRKRAVYRFPSLTKLVQQTVGVTADGKFGAKTRTAVMRWQSAHGIAADGVVGIQTWKRILGV